MLKGLNISLKEKIEISEEEKLLHSRIERLLFTSKEERPGRLEFGSIIPQLFYEPADADLLADIIREIQFLFLNYEKNLNLSSISTEIVFENDITGLIIKLEIINVVTNKEITLEFIKIKTL